MLSEQKVVFIFSVYSLLRENLPYFPSDLGLLIVYMYRCSGLFPCFHGSPRLNGQLNAVFDKGLIRGGAPLPALVYSPLLWDK